MPALFVYLIAVALLLGGGFGALSWLAAPEPVKVVAKATPKPPPPHYADNSEPASAEARPSKSNSAETGKSEVASKAEIDNSGQAKPASADKTASSDQPPSASPSPQPEPATAASRQEAGAQASGAAQDQQDRSAHAEMPQAATDQEANRQAATPPAEGPARHEEEKPSAQAASPGNAQTIAPNAPAAKRPQVRQASRRAEKRPLEMMTLRTIELPDGRRISQLVPYRGEDRYRDDGPAVAFDRNQ